MDNSNLLELPSSNGLSMVTEQFLPQSYFDSTAKEKAVLDPGVGDNLVSSTAKVVESRGYGVGLRPESETPVAVEFKKTSGGSKSACAILKPGQVIFPYGRGAGDDFQGLRWGLPYGWLGGGLASLVVFGSPRSHIDWPHQNREIIIHRQRMAVLIKTTAAAGVTLAPNWPTRFPSLGTKRAGTALALAAGGRPSLRAHPTRVAMRLRSAAVLTAPATVRFLIFNSNAFDLDLAGAAVAVTAGVTFQDVTFPSWSMAGTDLFAACPQFPEQQFTDGPLVHLGCELSAAAGVLALDLGDGADLSSSFIDIVRYGRL